MQPVTEDMHNQAMIYLTLGRQELLGHRAALREMTVKIQQQEGFIQEKDQVIQELRQELAECKVEEPEEQE